MSSSWWTRRLQRPETSRSAAFHKGACGPRRGEEAPVRGQAAQAAVGTTAAGTKVLKSGDVFRTGSAGKRPRGGVGGDGGIKTRKVLPFGPAGSFKVSGDGPSCPKGLPGAACSRPWREGPQRPAHGGSTSTLAPPEGGVGEADSELSDACLAGGTPISSREGAPLSRRAVRLGGATTPGRALASVVVAGFSSCHPGVLACVGFPSSKPL